MTVISSRVLIISLFSPRDTIVVAYHTDETFATIVLYYVRWNGPEDINRFDSDTFFIAKKRFADRILYKQKQHKTV